MTDFVLDQEFGLGNEFITNIEFSKKVINYAKFLKQPLELWMFAPCDKNGDALKGKPLSPNTDTEWIRWEKEEFEFRNAKEKCLFEGCVYDEEMEVVKSQDGDNIFYVPRKELWNIESTIQYNIKLTKIGL